MNQQNLEKIVTCHFCESVYLAKSQQERMTCKFCGEEIFEEDSNTHRPSCKVDQTNSWNRLPGAVRWLLLFPTIFLTVGVINVALYFLASLRGQSHPLILAGPFSGVLYLWFTNKLAPKYEVGMVRLLIILRSLLIPIILFIIVKDALENSPLKWKTHWEPLISETLVLGCSIIFYNYIKESRLKSPN